MENKEKETFSYTYSAKEQDEIQNIRRKYIPPEEDKMEYIRRLDRGVTRKAEIAALVLGVIGALFLGFGMSLAMTELSGKLGFTQGTGMCVGIFIGIIGIVMVCFAYPVYNSVIKKERARIAPEILRLTDELMK